MSRQMFEQMAKEICHDNNSSIATQRTEYRRRAMSQQKTMCRNKIWEECNKSAETKRDNVVTRFLMMDVKTRRNLLQHKSSCRDARNRKKIGTLS